MIPCGVVHGFAVDMVAAHPSVLLKFKTIIENPFDYLKSTYTPSFLQVCRASISILHASKAQSNVYESLTLGFGVYGRICFLLRLAYSSPLSRVNFRWVVPESQQAVDQMTLQSYM